MLSFDNKETLYDFYKGLKSNDLKKKEILSSYYKKGFLPSEVYSDIDVEIAKKVLIKKHHKKKNSLQYTENEYKSLIQNDNFKSLLNNSNEIVVGDSIYKYTERGLLAVSLKDLKSIRPNKIEENVSAKGIIDVSHKLHIPERLPVQNFRVLPTDDCSYLDPLNN